MKYAEIRLKRDSSLYTYSVPSYLEVAEGDTVVVNCNPHTRGDGFLLIGRVEALVEHPRNIESGKCKPIVDTVDVNRWREYQEKEGRIAELVALMEARAREVNAIALYRQMAESDEEMKTLMESYDSLAG